MDVVVVGCGVSGLTCAVRLQETGFPSTILTREVAADTTSATAAALWYPFRLCSEERMREWGPTSLERSLEARDG